MKIKSNMFITEEITNRAMELFKSEDPAMRHLINVLYQEGMEKGMTKGILIGCGCIFVGWLLYSHLHARELHEKERQNYHKKYNYENYLRQK